MRHGKKFNHLSRPTAHRKALLMNQAKSLILHKRIITTVAKAKALRKFVEPIITRAKQDSTHARRIVFSYFQDKEPVKLLFNEVAPKIGDRPGGYTRIIRMGNRFGDNAEMCLIELVDYNDYLEKGSVANQVKSKTRRGRGKSKSDVSAVTENTDNIQQSVAALPEPELNTQSIETDNIVAAAVIAKEINEMEEESSNHQSATNHQDTAEEQTTTKEADQEEE